jgi:pimeloyl-ACP methyl ester carboxylesterase
MDAQSQRLEDLTSAWEFCADNGGVLRGRRAAGRGPTLHFLSGAGFCGGIYGPFLRGLVPEYGLFTHDIEGHGLSDPPPGPRFSGIEAVLRRVHAALAAHQLAGTPLIGVGHSFGGALTMRLAADHPGLFRALVLLDPIFFPPEMWLAMRGLALIGRHPFAANARRRRASWPSRGEALERLRDRGIYQGWTEEALECFVDHALRAEPDGTRSLRCPPELEAQVFEHPVWPWRALPKVQCPVLFLRGARSYGFFARSEQLAARANPRVQLRQVAGGHCFMLEDPALAQTEVRNFLTAAGVS